MSIFSRRTIQRLINENATFLTRTQLTTHVDKLNDGDISAEWEVVLSALSAKNLEARLAEALPWVLLEYPDLDWQWLVRAAKLNDLQNKLGSLTNVARRLAEKLGKDDTAALMRNQESALEGSRLVKEDTLCHDSLTQAERRWLKSNRTDEAKHWNLLTDLSPEHLSHAL